MFYHHPLPEPPKAALEYLAKSRYGFSLVDLGITEDDLALFDRLDIDKNRDYKLIGDLSKLEEEAARFLREVGSNEESLVSLITDRICQMVQSIIDASNRKTGWVCLRSFVPTDSYDLANWHFDGAYFCPEKPKDLIYKFIVTLKGPSTLFYLVPREEEDFRRTLSRNVWNPSLNRALCDPNQTYIPPTGECVVFLAANKKSAALHSEPPVHEHRLLFSVAPCNEEDLDEVRGRVRDYFSPPAKSTTGATRVLN